MNQGIIKMEAGTGQSVWLIQPIPTYQGRLVGAYVYMAPIEGVSSIPIAWEESQLLTDKELGLVVEYETEDRGHELFKEGFYQPWILARIPKIEEIISKRKQRDEWSGMAGTRGVSSSSTFENLLRNADGTIGFWGTNGFGIRGEIDK